MYYEQEVQNAFKRLLDLCRNEPEKTDYFLNKAWEFYWHRLEYMYELFWLFLVTLRLTLQLNSIVNLMSELVIGVVSVTPTRVLAFILLWSLVLFGLYTLQ